MLDPEFTELLLETEETLLDFEESLTVVLLLLPGWEPLEDPEVVELLLEELLEGCCC